MIAARHGCKADTARFQYIVHTTQAATLQKVSHVTLQILLQCHGHCIHIHLSCISMAPAYRHLTYSAALCCESPLPAQVFNPLWQSRHSSETWEAVGALARHIILKTPDKADQRVIACDAAASIMVQLPVMHQHQFVLFTARLARTPKVWLCWITYCKLK